MKLHVFFNELHANKKKGSDSRRCPGDEHAMNLALPSRVIRRMFSKL